MARYTIGLDISERARYDARHTSSELQGPTKSLSKILLLYLAAFPEDYEIYVSDLIEIWIAQNFIQHKLRHKLDY